MVKSIIFAGFLLAAIPNRSMSNLKSSHIELETLFVNKENNFESKLDLLTKQKAVNNVSLNIEKEQIYGLLGPNGAGKSTTLKMLTGMMKPTAGKIYFDGKLLDRDRKSTRLNSSHRT